MYTSKRVLNMSKGRVRVRLEPVERHTSVGSEKRDVSGLNPNGWIEPRYEYALEVGMMVGGRDRAGPLHTLVCHKAGAKKYNRQRRCSCGDDRRTSESHERELDRAKRKSD